jgi:hypothetical protein
MELLQIRSDFLVGGEERVENKEGPVSQALSLIILTRRTISVPSSRCISETIV